MLLPLLFFSCRQSAPEEQLTDTAHLPATFQQILDSAAVNGSILVYDAQADQYHTNDSTLITEGSLPASTFKIVNSIIALETGVVQDDSTLFKWNGEDRPMDIWEKDMVFKEAFRLSCVPCYQQVARSIGPKRMNDYLNRLNYGDMKVDSSSIDQFWLVGESSISPMEQIDFLRRWYQETLPISERTYQIMKDILLIEARDAYRLSGKTGWAIIGEQHLGWFVGFVEKQKATYFFATRITPQPAFDMRLFAAIRQKVTMDALKAMKLID
jgi:beta-lactamase class D